MLAKAGGEELLDAPVPLRLVPPVSCRPVRGRCAAATRRPPAAKRHPRGGMEAPRRRVQASAVDRLQRIAACSPRRNAAALRIQCAWRRRRRPGRAAAPAPALREPPPLPAGGRLGRSTRVGRILPPTALQRPARRATLVQPPPLPSQRRTTRRRTHSSPPRGVVAARVTMFGGATTRGVSSARPERFTHEPGGAMGERKGAAHSCREEEEEGCELYVVNEIYKLVG